MYLGHTDALDKCHHLTPSNVTPHELVPHTGTYTNPCPVQEHAKRGHDPAVVPPTPNVHPPPAFLPSDISHSKGDGIDWYVKSIVECLECIRTVSNAGGDDSEGPKGDWCMHTLDHIRRLASLLRADKRT